ncbi:MAG TPA: hypothetical protein VF473_07645, partial [Cyclobacteriaceae bacterium]
LVYVPFVAGLLMLAVLLVIRIKRIKGYSLNIIWIASGVIVVQLFTGISLAIVPPGEQPNLGFVMIFMAVITIIATITVYRTLQSPNKFHEETPPKKIEKMISDYSDVMNQTTDLIERGKLKAPAEKPGKD